MVSRQVVIIGGGLAGGATALSLAGLGIDTIVIDRAGAVASDVVGECLSSTGVMALRDLGVDYSEIPKLTCTGLRSSWGNPGLVERNAIFQAGGYGDLVDRAVLSVKLRKEVEDRGVEWREQSRVVSVKRCDESWQVQMVGEFDARELTAQWIVDASGRQGAGLYQLEVPRHRSDKLTAVALRLKCEKDFASEAMLTIEATESGWWYLSPMPGGDMRLVYLTDSDLLLQKGNRKNWDAKWQEFIRETTHIHEVLEPLMSRDGILKAVSQVAASGSQRADHFCGDRWVAVGDAACAYDPLSSYGMTAALGSGIYAGRAIAGAIKTGQPEVQDYAAQLSQSFDAYLQKLTEQYAMEQRWPESEFWNRRR